MEKEKTIYELDLHEKIRIGNGCFVTRVSSGWIYELRTLDQRSHIVFVPFTDKDMYYD